ncbi:MAG: ATP-binding cassette domain-containing protein [Duncaniella sp.]|nr:ATP-binding cassette domain-containing protein [Duncaniella sp.]MDE6582498.1 ATP-binding cassette domain-containing protein [Duncaniella sp.]
MSNIIEYTDVELHRKDLVVMKHVNLKIQEGQFVYLLGKVGSGKSSLMKSMYAEVPIFSGSACVLDYQLASIKRNRIPFLRRQMGIVFQDFQLLHDRTAYSNLLFVLQATGWTDKTEMEERIEKVLRNVGLLNKSYKMPHELSGGEQQRIAIARAMLNNPRIILADEPTGNLDPATGEAIVSQLHAISRAGTTVIMATHNHGFVSRFPGRVMKCENKQLIEESF